MKRDQTAPATHDNPLTAPLRLRFLPVENSEVSRGNQPHSPPILSKSMTSLSAYFALGLIVGSGLWLYRGQATQWFSESPKSPAVPRFADHAQTRSTPIVAAKPEISAVPQVRLTGTETEASRIPVRQASYSSPPKALPDTCPQPLLDRLMNER